MSQADDFDAGDGPMDGDAPGGSTPLDGLLDAWQDGTLTDEDAAALAAALRGSAEARKIAARHLRLGAALRTVWRPFDEDALVRGTQAALTAQRDEDRFVRVFAERRARAERRPIAARRRMRALVGVAGIAAMAALVLVTRGRRPDPPALAWIGDAGAGAVVIRDRKPRAAAAGAPLRAGDRIETGAVELGVNFADGAWAQVGAASRVTLVSGAPGARTAHAFRIESGRLAVEQDSADPAGAATIETPHARTRSQDANYVVTVGARTRVDVWAGSVTLAARNSPATVEIRQGQYAETTGAEAPRLRWQSGYRGAPAPGTPEETVATTGAAQTEAPAADGKGGAAGGLALRPLARRADLPDATFPRGGAATTVTADLRDALYAGRGARLDWESFVPVGAGRWLLGPDGISQTTLAIDGTQFSKDSYAKGVLNMGQLPLDDARSLRVQARIRIDEAGPAPWSVGVVLLFARPRTIGCYHYVTPQRRYVALEAVNTPAVPFNDHTTWPRGPAPEEAGAYFIALSVVRPARGDAAVRCRVWADGHDPATGTLLEGHLPIEGEAERLGLRTFRVTATYQNVEVVPSDDPAAVAPL